MRCRQAKALLAAFDDGELSPTESTMIERHVAGCIDCWFALAAYRAVRGQLALLKLISVDTQIADETISRIRAEAITRRAESQTARRGPHKRPSRGRARSSYPRLQILPLDEQGNPLPD
jgi:anti-sigma factor RsiW